jgi:hypothetical protein
VVPPRTVEHIEQLERVEQSRTNGDSARTERTRTSLSQFDPRTALEQPCCSDCANKSNRSCHPGRSASHPAATAAVTSHRRRRITLIVVFDLAPPSRSHPLASPLSPHPSPSSPLSLLNHHPALQLRETGDSYRTPRMHRWTVRGVWRIVRPTWTRASQRCCCLSQGYTNPRICTSLPSRNGTNIY